MIVLSLFDGISCGIVALERAGIKVDKYYASEIDKYAIQISKKNYPEIIQLGDITQWKSWEIDFSEIDLLVGGFPCQSWSVAGKRQGMMDKRGQLLYHMLDIRNEILKVNPDLKYIFENVMGSKKNKTFLDSLIGIESVLINSALVSAQNRKRLYWCNFEINQPKDKKMYLKDILENNVDEKYIVKINKASCITGGGNSGSNHSDMDLLVFEKTKRIGVIGKGGQGQRIYSINGKSVALSALGGGQGAKTGLYAIKSILKVREATKKGYVDVKPNQGVDLTFINSKTRRGRLMKNKSNCLTATNYDYCWWDGYIIRRLTPVECERLQTLPDNYTEGVSNTQRYKALGNGWTVDIITYILKHM